MQKITLESIIEKYYLNGLVESIKFDVKDKNVDIAFIPTEVKSLVGFIKCPNFQLEDCKIAIYNTSQLIKLIKILDHDIELNLHKEKTTTTKLLLSDNKYDLEYYLADLHLIPPTPKISEPEVYDISFNLTSEFISDFNNAKKALGDIKRFTVEANQLGENYVTFRLGESSSFSNKIKFNTHTDSKFNLNAIPFEANLFNEVLLANKDSDGGKFELSHQGLIKLTFKEKEIESTYFLVGLES